VEDSPCGRVVLTDASVLINFLHLGRLDLLNSLPGYVFMVPDHVLEEISDPKQREHLETGIRSGFLTILSITDLEEIESYAQFHRTLGQGESACLAVALRRRYFVASDERGVFRRTSTAAIGRERILTTEGNS
jgi:predicted nucleic acid-binding protein